MKSDLLIKLAVVGVGAYLLTGGLSTVITTSRKQDKQAFAREYFIATLQQSDQQPKEDWLGAIMTVAKMYFSGGTVA